MEKIVNIIESIAHEKGLKLEEAKEGVTTAMINTAKKVFGEQYDYSVEIDDKSKELTLYQKVLVVANDDERLAEVDEEDERFITIDEAKKVDPEIEVGDELTYRLSLDNMGRTAAAILFRELEYHLQRLLERNIFEKYKQRVGEIISGTVTRVDNAENTYVEFREVRAILPMKSRIKGEKFKVGDVIKAVIRRVYIDKKLGMQVELSRTSPKFLEELLRLEVPEIKDEMVLVQGASRIPGERAKVALTALSPNVDPVGATVGTKGVRINAVSKELHGENIDCIEYSSIPEKYIARALSPAIISAVRIEGEKAIVTLPADQKSKAIGKSGINIRLASMLTGYEIELVELGGTATAEGTQERKEGGLDALKALFGEN